MKLNKLVKKYSKVYSSINILFWGIYWVSFLLFRKTPQDYIFLIVAAVWFVALVLVIVSEILISSYKRKYFKLVEAEFLSKKDSLTKEDFENLYKMKNFIEPIRQKAKDIAIGLEVADNRMFADVWYIESSEKSYTIEIELGFIKVKYYTLSINDEGTVSFKKK